MSVEVADRLDGLARRGEERRRRMSDIRRRSRMLMDLVHQLTSEHRERVERWQLRRVAAPQEESSGQETKVLAGNVLEQVRSLLVEVDSRERELWSEDDVLLLILLQEAWTVAVRRGYTLDDMQAIVQALSSSGTID